MKAHVSVVLFLFMSVVSPFGRTSVLASSNEAAIPNLVFSTNLGTSGYASANGVASDADGNLYIVGDARDAHFGGSPRVTVLGTLGGENDVYVLKMNAAGTAIEFVTLLGGAARDTGKAIALDASGNIYVAAVTESAELPVSGRLSRPFSGSSDVYLAKLSPEGANLLYATYLGGSDVDSGPRLAVTAGGRVTLAVSTLSPNFPVTVGDAPTSDAFSSMALSVSPDGGRLIYSRRVGPIGVSSPVDVALDGDASVVVAGDSVVKLSAAGDVTASARRDLEFVRATVGADGSVYTAAVAFDEPPRTVYLYKWTPDLSEIASESRFDPRASYRVTFGDLRVDGDGNLYLADFEDGSTENYYGVVRRIDPKGRIVYDRQLTDALVGLSLSPSRRVGLVGNSYFEWPTFNALVPDRGPFRYAFAAQLQFPTETGEPPTVASVERRPKPANPNRFRVVITGANIQPGAVVFVGDSKTADPAFVVKSSTKIVRRNDLLEDGQEAVLTIVNPDGGEVSATYSR